MARRIVAGILGGVVGVLPLVLVNLLVNAGGALGGLETVAAENAAALGIMALLGGVLVGGMLAGWLAGREGGAPAAGLSGAVAALLYAVTVILVVVGGARQGWGPSVAAIHPIRVSAAILLVACLLLGVALTTGALTGRRAAAQHTAQNTARQPAPPQHPGYGPGYGSYAPPRDARYPAPSASGRARAPNVARRPASTPPDRSTSRDRW